MHDNLFTELQEKLNEEQRASSKPIIADVWRMWANMFMLTVSVLFFDEHREFLTNITAIGLNLLNKVYGKEGSR